MAIPRVFFSSVLHSAKRVFTKCRCSSRGTLGKDFFAECPRFYPGQPFVHSANKVFPVANRHTSSAFKTQNKYTHAHGSSYQTEPTTTLVTFSSKLKLQILQSNDVERQLELDKKSTSAFDLSCVGGTFYPSPLLFKLCWVSIFCDDGSCKCAFRKISCPVYSPCLAYVRHCSHAYNYHCGQVDTPNNKDACFVGHMCCTKRNVEIEEKKHVFLSLKRTGRLSIVFRRETRKRGKVARDL